MPVSGRPLRLQRNDDGAHPAAVVEPSVRARFRWRRFLAAAVGGVLGAVLGTALHAHIWYLGSFGLPAGAVAAIVLCISIAVFVAVATRSVPMAALTGAIAYGIVGLTASFSAGGLIAVGVEVDGGSPPVAVAGYVWVIGLAVGTVIAVAVSWWVLRHSAQRTERVGRVR